MIKVNRTWEVVIFTHKKQGGYRDISIELSINRDTKKYTICTRNQEMVSFNEDNIIDTKRKIQLLGKVADYIEKAFNE